MTKYREPRMPDVLQPAWKNSDRLQATHQSLQTARPDYLPGFNFWSGNPYNVRSVDMPHDDMADWKTAIVVPFPYGTGHAPHMAARLAMIGAAAPQPTRVIGLPNSIVGEPAMDLSRRERSAIAHGDFTPYNEKALRTLGLMGVERMHVVAYSQGAAAGASLMALAAEKGVMEVGDAGIFEPPNLTQQSRARLALTFARIGTQGMFDAMDAAELPMLRESTEAMPMVRGLRNLVLPVNRAMAGAMAHHPLSPDAEYLAGNTTAQLTFMRAQHSTIAPKDPFDTLVANLNEQFAYRPEFRPALSVEIPDADHGWGDNVAAHGALAAVALANI